MALSLGWPAQAQLPTLGDGNELSVSGERRMGERIMREIYRDPDYLDDPVLGDYLQSLWRPLLSAARSRGDLSPELSDKLAWEMVIARDRSVNAFALPGGYLGVHLGLLGLTANRHELASVLAHELSHVTQRHIARLIAKQNQQTPLVIGAMILGALAASKSPEAAQAAVVGGQALAAQNQLNFSRDMEREADRIGFGVLSSAGFDPQGFVGMFGKLQAANRLSDNGSFPYLRSHPLTTERIADMQARAPEGRSAGPLPEGRAAEAQGPIGPLNPANAKTPANTPALQSSATQVPVNADWEHALMAARARALADPRADAQRAWMAQARSASLAQAEPVRQAGILYAGALAASRQREHAVAQQLLNQLKEAVASIPTAQTAINLLASELALSAGDGTRALAALGPAAASATGRATALQLAQAQLAAGRAAPAAQQLQLWVAERPQDALAWQLLAQAHAANHQPLRAVRAEAESRYAQLDYTAAIDRFRAAQDLARRPGTRGSDDVEAAIIDTRLRQVQAQWQALQREERDEG